MKAVDITNNFPPQYTGTFFTAEELTGNQKNYQVFAFILARSQMAWNFGERPTGFLKQKCKQLEMIGFHPIVVNDNVDFASNGGNCIKSMSNFRFLGTLG